MHASRRVDGVQVALDDDGGIFPAQILDHLLDSGQPLVLVVPIDGHLSSVRLHQRSIQRFTRDPLDIDLSRC